MGGPKPEVGPDIWIGCQGGAPIPTDVRGGDKVLVIGVML